MAGLFLKLGLISFGGPAAHVALMEDEVVRRRGWVTREEFLDLVGATILIPGPNSTELAIHLGQRRAGFPGLVVAGVCFIVPAMLLVLACAWAYVKYGALPQAAAVLYGVKPVIVAVVLQALWNLGKTAFKRFGLWVVGAVSVGLVVLGVHELLVLFAGGLMALLGQISGGSASASSRAGSVSRRSGLVPAVGWITAAAAPAAGAGVGAGAGVAASASLGLGSLFLFFLKVGSVLYGSGYVLLAFLRRGLVERYGWLNERELLDAVAVGQVTPGPVFTTATFVGYLIHGASGACVATIGIFLPAFVLVALSGPLVPRLRASPMAGKFLDGINVASWALMAVVTAQLSEAALMDATTVGLGLTSAVVLLKLRWNSAWLVLAGALVGWLRMTW